MSKKPKAFIIVYDSDESFCVPCSEDSDCPGAVCTMDNGPIRLFSSRKEAARAIRITRAFALLTKAQGLPYNEDFVEGLKFVRILPCI